MAGNNPFRPPGGGPPGVGGAGGVPVGGDPSGGAAGPPPPQAGSGPGPVPPSKQGQPFADVHQNMKYVQNQFKDVTRAQQVLDHLRVELDQLMEMGDMVRPEHVIEAAGRLVGHGIGATQLAQIMSDMPSQGGEGLASWVRMHDVTVTGAEQQLAQERIVIGHRLGVAGIKSLAAVHLEQEQKGQGMKGQPPAPDEGANALGGAPLGDGGGGDMSMPAPAPEGMGGGDGRS